MLNSWGGELDGLEEQDGKQPQTWYQPQCLGLLMDISVSKCLMSVVAEVHDYIVLDVE